MQIPDEKIQEIRNAIDIVEYIGSFVRLKKRGKNYIGLCPFHSEKTPSFNVSPDKQMYYCFGCQRGGDVITFAMTWEKASYIEAIEILAERAGIEIIRTQNSSTSSNDTEQLYNICTFAARIFYDNLRNTEEGKFALQYLHSRGFNDKTITTFGLGYSLRGWDSLIAQCKEAGINAETLTKVGLTRKRDDGTFYDAFRGRVMFPIFSPTGRVIAFGARKIYDDDMVAGKYINSAETIIYKKSKVLYGLYQAKDAIREKDFVILVEGYADAISVYQVGFKNVVASSGTALTSEQVQLIARYTKNIILLYDADSAGANAMFRGIDIILENGLDVRIVQLPSGDDPDSFIQKNDADAFYNVLSRAVSFIDFMANSLQQEGKFETPESRTKVIHLLVETIAKMQDPVKQTFFIKDIAEKYKLYESLLYDELEKFKRKNPNKFSASIAEHSLQKSSVEKKFPPLLDIPLYEKELLAVIFENPTEMIPFIFTHIQSSDFFHEEVRKIILIILDEFDTTGNIDLQRIYSKIENDNLKKIISDVSFTRYQLSTKWESIGAKESETKIYEQALGAIKALKKRALQAELDVHKLKIKEASFSGEDIVPFLQQQQELIKKIAAIELLTIEKVFKL